MRQGAGWVSIGEMRGLVIRAFGTVVLAASIALGAQAGAASSVHAGEASAPLVTPSPNTTSLNTSVLHVKLRRPAAISATRTAFRADTPQHVRLDALLGGGSVQQISKLSDFTGGRAAYTAVARALDDYYVVRYRSGVDMARVIARLQQSGLVAAVYAAPRPAPLPATPSFVGLQNYRSAAPTGSDSSYADGFPGGRGGKVKLVDVEYSWNVDHEDLAKAKTALVSRGTPVDPFGDANHGTAVLGEIVGTKNAFGVTGAAYAVSLALVNADSVEFGYDVAGALATAATITQPGDVIQIEQQAIGPDGPTNYVPVEWIPEVYDAIKSLTASGRIVVEPAGNGSENLDDTALYGTRFPLGKADSGAIIVGAGENCGSSPPRHSRVVFSNYGSRIDLQGPGDCVVTTGYGDLYGAGTNTYYTQGFSGTSSATPVVAAAAAALSSAYKSLNHGAVLRPDQVRSILERNSTPQSHASGALAGNIGPYPDLRKALLRVDITAPAVAIHQPATLVRLATSVPVAWSATDAIGVANFDVRRDTAAWNRAPTAWVSWQTQTHASSASYKGPYGQTSCFEARARDKSGNVSGWASPRCAAVPLRSDQLSYSKQWSKSAAAQAFAGFNFVTTAHGARMYRIGIVARQISLVVTTCAACGAIEVRWNGKVVKVVHLHSATTARKQVVLVASFPTAKTGNLTATVISPSGKPVHIEGLAAYNGR